VTKRIKLKLKAIEYKTQNKSKYQALVYSLKSKMDPGWPANPPNTLICILCKSAMPYYDDNPERFFRHLLADHCTYFNLNLLLEISLVQPHAVREESQPLAGGIQPVAESVVDHVKVQPFIKERKASSSSLVEPDSTSNQENTSNLLVNTSRVNLQVNFNLEETCPTAQPGGSSITNPQCSRAGSTVEPQNPPTYHNLQPPPKALPKPDPRSNQFIPEEISDFDLGCFLKQITQPDTEQSKFQHPSQLQPPSQLPSTSTFIPFESKPSPFLLQSRDPYLHDIKPYTPNMYTMNVAADFGALDPISFVKQEPKTKRKVTRQLTVNKNNQPVPYLPDNPNRHLVSEDLQMLIIRENPARGIKFTYSQRMNTQMVVDDYVLKKKKGPYLTRGGRVVNWKCTNDHCQYTAVTWEGQLQDTARQHNHPRQPELYVKKQARVKIRENMGRDILNLSNTTQEEKPVNNVVMDVVTETNPDMRNMIGSIDALKQAARRYNRKLHKESQQVYVPNLFVESDRLYLPDTVYQNYEVVGEFPTDYQFPLEVSDQVAHYTEVSTVDIDTPDTPSVTVETDTVEPVTMHTVAVETVSGGLFTDVEVDVLAGSVNNSEQVTLDEETGAMISEDTVVEKMIEDSTTLKINEIEIFTKDDVEELLEPSPVKESSLRDELISE